MDAPDTTADDTTADRLRRVASTFTEVVDSLGPEDWNRPAPCVGWTARDVVLHLTSWVSSVFSGAGISFPVADRDDPRGAWVALATALQRAVEDPEVGSRTFDAGPPGTMTIDAAVDMLVVGDVLVHTWDLARAADRDVRLDEQLAAGMLAGMEPMDTMLRESGHFGPRVDVDPAADPVTRLLAFTGRDPGWSPV